MATVVIGLAVGYLAGSAGAIVGAAITAAGFIAGTYVDNEFLYPAIFPPDKVTPRKLANLSALQNDEGTPCYFSLGPQCRVPGTVIWRSTLQKNNNVGGNAAKGSTSSASSGADYYRNLAVSWNVGDEATYKVLEILAEGKTVYVDTAGVDIDSSALSVVKYQTYRWKENIAAAAVDDTFMDILSPIGGPDLSALYSGLDVVVAGWTDSNNNGTFRVVFSEIDTVDGTSFVRLRNVNVVAEIASGSVKSIDQALPSSNSEFADDVTNYLGSDTQLADAEWQAVEGIDNVPAHRGETYSLIKRLYLNPFGLRIPQLVARIAAHQTMTIGNAIVTLCGRCGIDSSQVDVSAVVGNTQGVVLNGPTEVAQVLTPLMLAYNLLAAERDGKLVFFPRELATEVPVNPAHVGARFFDQSFAPSPHLEDVEPVSLPKFVVVNYLEALSSLQDGSQRAVNRSAPGDTTLQAKIPIVMTAQEACAIANRLLWTRWANSQTITFSLPPSYLHVEEGDVLTFTKAGVPYRVLALRLEVTYEGLIVVTGVNEVSSTLTFPSCPAEGVPLKERVLYFPPEVVGEVLDLEPLRSGDETTSGLYWASCAYDRTALWVNVHLHQAGNLALNNWTSVQRMRQEAVIGELEGTMPAGSTDWWDEGTSITVKVFHGTLGTAEDDLAVLNMEENQCLIGGELCAFRNVTSLGNGRYTLTRWLRGRQGTKQWVARHALNERFILLDPGTIRDHRKPRSTRGRIFAYEVVSNGGNRGDFTAGTFPQGATSYAMNRMRPFPPHNLRSALVSGSGDYSMYWQPIARDLGAWFPGPSFASEGRFWVEMWDADPHATWPFPAAANLLHTIDTGAGTPGLGQYTLYMGVTAHASAGLGLGDPHYITIAEYLSVWGGFGQRSPALFVDML